MIDPLSRCDVKNNKEVARQDTGMKHRNKRFHFNTN